MAETTEQTVSDIIKADIHDVLTHKVLVNMHKKTVFESLGIAIEDVAAAWFIWNKAKTHPSI